MPKNNNRDFAKRALQIAGDVLKHETSDYTSNITTIINESKEIKDKFTQGKNTAKDTFNHVRKNGFKDFVDWFYGEASDTSEYDFANDDDGSDFDAGFKLKDDDGDGDSAPKVKVLDEDSMRGIAKGQVNAMYKIAGKQAETSIMNMSEIKTTMIEQSAAIIASINSTNDLLTKVNDNLTKIIELNSVAVQQAQQQQDSLLTDGRFTLKTLTQGFRNAIENSQVGQVIDIASSVKENMGPAELISAILGMTSLKSRQFEKLGGRSIDQIGEEFNRTVGNTFSNMIAGIFDSTLGKKLSDWLDFDIHSGQGNQDYSYMVKNQYTKDKAMFDNMTRQSIVHVIPEYLRVIAGALTGKNYTVTSYGQLTSGIQANSFQQTVQNSISSFGSGITNTGTQNKMLSSMQRIDSNISSSDMHRLGHDIVASVVFYLLSQSKGNFSIGAYKEMKGELFNHVLVDIFNSPDRKGNQSYWRQLVAQYFSTLEMDTNALTEFCTSVNQSMENMVSQATHNAMNSMKPNELGPIIAYDDDNGHETYKKYVYNTNTMDLAKAQQQINDRFDAALEALGDKRKGTSDIEKARKKALDEVQRKFNPSEFGDTSDEIANVIETAYQQRMGQTRIVHAQGGISNYDPSKSQNRITSSLEKIIGILKNDIIKVHVVEMVPSQPVETPVQQPLHISRARIRGIRKKRSGGNTGGGDESSDDGGEDGIASSTDDTAVEQLSETMLLTSAVDSLGSDGNVAEDANVLNQMASDMSNDSVKSKAKNLIRKLTNRKDKENQDGDKPKGLIGTLIGGAKKLFAPITALLAPVTKIIGVLFKPALQLIKKGLQSGVGDIKKGFSQIKEGATEIADKATGGRFSKAKEKIQGSKDKVNEFLGNKTTEEASVVGGIKETETKIVEKMESIEESQSSNVDKIVEKMESIEETIKSTSKEQQQQASVVKSGGAGFNMETTGWSTYKTKKQNQGYYVNYDPTPTANMDTSEMSFDNVNVGEQVGDGISTTANTSAAGNVLGKVAGGSLMKVLGGIGSVLIGIGKIVLTIVASLTAFKTFMNFVKTTLTKSLKPINKAIKELSKALKPLVKTLGNVLKKLSDIVVSIVDKLTKVLIPIVEVISKVLKTVMKTLEPILDSIVDFLDRFGDLYQQLYDNVAPFIDQVLPIIEEIGGTLGDLFSTVFDAVVDLLEPLITISMPFIELETKVAKWIITGLSTTLKGFTGSFKLLIGTIELGIGQFEAGLGTIIEALGKVLNAMPLGSGDWLETIGQKMHESGLSTIDKGIDNTVTGTLMMIGLDDKSSTKKTTNDTSSSNVSLPTRTKSSGMNMDGTVTSDTYGSGDQASYGSYLNMAKRGCGPLALADAVSRRTGASVDARNLTTAMYASGNYSTNKGTSVSGYINTANAMGLGYKTGGVTTSSLKYATPNNPITVVGSGVGYGTKSGNTHYVNVLGVKNGIAYTSNPLTGKVERRYANDIASGALLGLYGSGDISLPDSLADKFAELKEKASGLFSLFSFEDDIETEQKKAELESQYKEIKNRLTAKEMAEVEKAAFEKWSAKNPRGNRSASDYLASWNKHKLEYIVDEGAYKVLDITQENTGEIGDNSAEITSQLFGFWDKATGAFSGGAATLVGELARALRLDAAESSYSSGGNGAGVLATVPAVVKAYEAVGVVGNDGDYNQSGKTHTLTINGKQYNERPDCTGLVDSVIDAMGYNSEGMNSARFNSAAGIKDSSGNISPDWQMIDNPSIDSLQGGDIGIIYNGSAHHGEIVSGVDNGTVYGFSYGWEGGMARALAAVNEMLNGVDAFTATKNNKGAINGHKYYTRAIRFAGNTAADGTGSGTVSGGTTEQQVWAYMTQVLGFTPAGAAGVMGNLQKESGMKPNNLEDIYNKQLGMSDEQYTSAVDSGSYSRAKFISDHNKANCGAGYGLPQFTYYNLKEALYDIAKSKGVSISDVGAQLDAIAQTVDSGLVEKLRTTNSVKEASDLWLTKYEKPKNMEAQKSPRAAAGQQFYDKYASWDGSGVTVSGGSSYATAGQTAGKIGSRVRDLLTAGTLNLTGNSTLESAFNAAVSTISNTAGGQLLNAASNVILSDTTKNVLGTVANTAMNVSASAANGLRNLISNKITTAGNVVSTWWNGMKNLGSTVIDGYKNAATELSEIGEDGIVDTFKSIGQTVLDTQTGFVGSIADYYGDQFQVLYNGAKNDIQIVEGTAEDVATEIGKGIGGIAGALVGSQEVGDTTKGSKLKNYLSGKYGQVSYLTDDAESLLGLFAKQIANSAGAFSQQTSTSSYGSTFDDGSYDETSDEFTVIPIADNSDYAAGYEQAVDARMKSRWKSTFDEGMKLWGSTTRNGKAPENWWNKYITNKSMADYYRTEYPQAVTGQAFSTWYQNKFYKSTAQKNKEAANGITNARLLAQKLAYTDKPSDMVALLKQYPQYATDSEVKKQFTRWGYDKQYEAALRSINVSNWSTKDEMEENGVASTILKARIAGSGDIPPLDMSRLQQYFASGDEEYVTQQPSQIVNQYITTTDGNTDWIDRLESVTFNVRAEKVEALLQDIDNKLSTMSNNKPTTVVQQSQDEDNRIPQQVTRLARG